MKGECLFGSVKFEIDEEIRNLYQCHCSLCRKATGAAANAATLCAGKFFSLDIGRKQYQVLQKIQRLPKRFLFNVR